MLILTRKTGESFFIGDNIEVTVAETSGDRVKIIIDAPKEIIILRKELKELKDVNLEAAENPGNDVAYIENILKSKRSNK